MTQWMMMVLQQEIRTCVMCSHNALIITFFSDVLYILDERNEIKRKSCPTAIIIINMKFHFTNLHIYRAIFIYQLVQYTSLINVNLQQCCTPCISIQWMYVQCMSLLGLGFHNSQHNYTMFSHCCINTINYYNTTCNPCISIIILVCLHLNQQK